MRQFNKQSPINMMFTSTKNNSSLCLFMKEIYEKTGQDQNRRSTSLEDLDFDYVIRFGKAIIVAKWWDYSVDKSQWKPLCFAPVLQNIRLNISWGDPMNAFN